MAQKLIWILALRAVILQLPLGLFRGVLFGDQQIGLVNLVSVLSNLTYGTLAYSFLHQQAGVTGVAWASLIAMVLEHLFYMVLVYVRVPGFVLSRQLFRMERLTTLFNFSWHQFVCDAASLVLLHLDLILVQLLAGLEAVAIYAVALRLTTQGYLFSKQFVNTLSPMFAELKGREEVASIRSTFSRGTHIAIAPALALLTLAIIFGQSGLSLWLGPGFHEAWPILILLLLATAVGLPVSVAGSLLANTGHHRSLSLASAISIAANFCLSIVGFHFLGLIGIALGTLLTKVLVEHPLITVKACQIYQISPIKLLHSVITTQAWPLSLMIVTVLALDAMIGQSSLLRITLISLCGTVVYFYLLKSRSQKSTEPQIVGSS